MLKEKGYWINKDTRDFAKNSYLEENISIEDRIKQIAKSAESYLKIKGYAEKFEDYVLRGWFSLSSPVWGNFGNKRGLPISCNGSALNDSLTSILEKNAEIGMMTKHGAGTSAYFGALRPRGSKISKGGKSEGPVRFMELFESSINIVSQSNIRRGSCAVYLDVEHPDIMEFLNIRSEGNPIQNLSFGVCVGDKFMESIEKLMKDSNAEDIQNKKIWAKILDIRFRTGYPYIFFKDTVNNNAPEIYKKKGLKIHASNLCSEIALSSDEKNSFVCCLASMNLLHYDEWKDTDAVKVLTYFLDAVMEEYIQKVEHEPFMKAAYNFAKAQRALGLGVLGWHSFLQSKMIAFESLEAKMYNVEIHKYIFEQAKAASKEMAEIYGEPELMKGTGLRNSTVCAIAPTTSSSFILGQVSPSIEPLCDNYFVKDLAKGSYVYKNPFLIELLESLGRNTFEVWNSILKHGGSVQHLEFLTREQKDVFKTFGEISQKEIIIQAFQRQKYIDQAQSLNLMIHPKTPARDVNKLLIYAWRNGVKTLYYQRSTNPAQELSRNLLDCASCSA